MENIAIIAHSISLRGVMGRGRAPHRRLVTCLSNVVMTASILTPQQLQNSFSPCTSLADDALLTPWCRSIAQSSQCHKREQIVPPSVAILVAAREHTHSSHSHASKLCLASQQAPCWTSKLFGEVAAPRQHCTKPWVKAIPLNNYKQKIKRNDIINL